MDELLQNLIITKSSLQEFTDLMKSFKNLTAVQMEEYLHKKIDILKVFLYE